VSARESSGFFGDSHVGLVRDGNEDAFLLAPPLFAVADGLGGHQAGEVASSIAIDSLLASAPRNAAAKALGRAVRQANAAVMDAAATGRGRSGMGTTLTAAMIDGMRIAIAHVGDSRAYLLHYGELQQLTADHSMVADLVRQGQITAEESRHHPNRSVITRALGSDPNMVVDTFEIVAAEGDRLLLATDGLTGVLADDEIRDHLAHASSADDAVRTLIDSTLGAGAPDNVTVVVVDIGRARKPEGRGQGARRWMARIAWLIALAAIVIGAAWAAESYARSRAYLIEENGFVSVHEGVPGSFAGISLDFGSRPTTIPVEVLDPVTASRLREGIRVNGIAEADRLLEEYRRQAAEASTTTEP
jgi:protein phosphatase